MENTSNATAGNVTDGTPSMSQQYLKISTDGKNWREMRDTERTEKYIDKLSFAAIVKVLFCDGSWYEKECGKTINRGDRL
jgi:hypothetical protein